MIDIKEYTKVAKVKGKKNEFKLIHKGEDRSRDIDVRLEKIKGGSKYESEWIGLPRSMAI